MAGLVVIDAASVVAGPMVATLLGDYGARVLTLEEPATGDSARGGLGPNSSMWRFYARNKESITCKLSNPDGAELFKRLIAKVDVLIEGFRPGRFESWGLSYEELSKVNPGLVMLRVSGFGQTGPYASRPGYGTVAESIGGLPYVTGEPDGPPALPGVPVADVMTGFAGLGATLMALWSRERTGRGAEIDISLYAAMLYQFGPSLIECDLNGMPVERRGNQLAWIPSTKRPRSLRDAQQCKDGKWVAYSVVARGIQRRVMDFLRVNSGNPRAQEIDTSDWRLAVQTANDLLKEWIATQDRNEVLKALNEAEIPIAPIYNGLEILEDPHFVAREEFTVGTDPDGKTYRMPVGPFRINGVPPRPNVRTPDLGEHNVAVYHDWLGIGADEMARLDHSGAI